MLLYLFYFIQSADFGQFLGPLIFQSLPPKIRLCQLRLKILIIFLHCLSPLFKATKFKSVKMDNGHIYSCINYK